MPADHSNHPACRDFHGVRSGVQARRGRPLEPGLTGATPFVLVLLMAAPSSAAAQTPGSQYLVDGRCVTTTEVRNGQVSYAWRAGNASGSGSLPADMLGPRCTTPIARPPAGNQAPRQEPGEASPAPGAPAAAGRAGDAASAGFA